MARRAGCSKDAYVLDRVLRIHADGESLDQEIWQAKEMLKWAHRVAVTQFEERARIENKDKRKVKVELTALVSTLKREK